MSAPALELTPVELARFDRVLRGVPPTFRDWNERTSPGWSWGWRHLAALQDELDLITYGLNRFLIVEMPPRHGKSEGCTVRYPVYRLEDDPTHRTIIGSYADELAQAFSRKARRLARHAGIALSEERRAVHDWETLDGGGIRAAGVGTGVTGHGANTIVVDDPVKNRQEAESALQRERVWWWFTDDLYSRLEPGGSVIVIMTRWHMDDLAGRLIEREPGKWRVLRLPALADTEDPLGRPEYVQGRAHPLSALCPDRFPVETLEEIRDVMGAYSFSALYQQRPVPREGNQFPRGCVTFVDAPPAGTDKVRYWDKAGTEGDGDFTAGVLMQWYEGRFYVEDVCHGQWGAQNRNKEMRARAETDGRRVRGWVEQEPGSGGKESAEHTVQMMAGFNYHYEPASGKLEDRADAYAAQWQAGNVVLVRGAWNKAFLDEHEVFPSGKHDDQVAAAAGAFNRLTLGDGTGMLGYYAKQAAAVKARKAALAAARGNGHQN